jgi:signal transduction histidine kinase/ligand-binding sensor domain-containing protein
MNPTPAHSAYCRRRTLFLRGACLWTVIGLCCISLLALDPQRDIHQFAHRSWLEKDGYPGQPRALAQTRDGFLWIGANDGLYRFDGVRFERYLSGSGDKLQGGAVLSLLAVPDGGLWIGFAREGRISVLRNGKVTNYDRAAGLPVDTTILSIAQDHEGTMWANTGTGLIRLNGTKWERVDSQWNVPQEMQHTGSTALFVDSHGTLWAGVGNTVMYLKQGSKRFEPTGAYAGQARSIAEAPDGKIWMADDTSATRMISMPVSVLSTARAECEVRALRLTDKCPSDSQFEIRTDALEVLFDRNGSLWVTAMTHGLLRLPDPQRLKNEPIKEVQGEVQSFTSKDGLSADNCASILEDREGNIWVATRDGLDQFRDTKLVPVMFPTSTMEIGLAPADGGYVWASANFESVARIDGYSMKLPLKDAEVYSTYRDPAGVTWLLGGSDLKQLEKGRFHRVAGAPKGLSGIGGDMQIVSDKSGTLWAFVKGLGFFSLDRHRWKALPTPPTVAKLWPTVAFCDNTGRIWVSTYSGDIVTMDKGNIATYSLQTNSLLKYVSAFAPRGLGVWITSADGMLLFDNGRSTLIKPAGSDHFGFIPGIVDAGSEGVWFITVDGVIHVPSPEIEKSLEDPSHRFQWEQFDSTDGLPGRGKHSEPYPHVIQGSDGRIWFIATKGVAWIDPRRILRNSILPPVSITSVSADGSPHVQLVDLRLPARTANVQINYSALSLSVPEKVQFRYKLDGIDKDWQNPGTRREALYSRLPPGRYEFHVIACNNDGVWNKVGANLSFAIAPAWFQTIWFEFLVALAGLALVWMAYTLRLRQATAHIQERLGTQMEERERIARELHDTLLQSFQGLTLQFQRARNLLPDRAAEAIPALEAALDGAEEAIVEGRDAIHDLRAPTSASKALAEEITALGEELAAKASNQKEPVQFRTVVEGSPRALRPNAYIDIFRIARETLRNAFSHSHGHLIETEFAYTESLFRLRIRDDGKGIDPDERVRAERSGHWGLKGIRERAERLGGELEVWSEPGAGTEIELRIPASIAYEKVLSQGTSRLFLRRNRKQ